MKQHWNISLCQSSTKDNHRWLWQRTLLRRNTYLLLQWSGLQSDTEECHYSTTFVWFLLILLGRHRYFVWFSQWLCRSRRDVKLLCDSYRLVSCWWRHRVFRVILQVLVESISHFKCCRESSQWSEPSTNDIETISIFLLLFPYIWQRNWTRFWRMKEMTKRFNKDSGRRPSLSRVTRLKTIKCQDDMIENYQEQQERNQFQDSSTSNWFLSGVKRGLDDAYSYSY